MYFQFILLFYTSALLTEVRALYLYVGNISATLVNHIIVEKYIFRDPEPRAL